MGQNVSVFSDQELADYEDLTFFSRDEVMHVFKKFKALAPAAISANRDQRLPMEIILNYPALKVNPFGDRICMVFSSTPNKDGDCNFEDFLDIMSVFNEDAPLSLKAEYAFRIFDFDGDDMLGAEDMEETIRRLLGDEDLGSRLDIPQLILELTSEADLDDDGMLSFAEFEHVVAKSQDFLRSFRILILDD